MVRVDLRDRGMPWVELLLRSRSSTTALNLGPRPRLSALASVAAVGALAARRPAAAGAAVGVLAVLNRDFYALLARRPGPGGGAGGIPLHVLHHVTAVLAVPAGVAAYLVRDAGVQLA